MGKPWKYYTLLDISQQEGQQTWTNQHSSSEDVQGKLVYQNKTEECFTKTFFWEVYSEICWPLSCLVANYDAVLWASGETGKSLNYREIKGVD